MKFEKLTPEARQSFEADGFLVVRNALDANQVRELNAATDRLAAEFLAQPPVHNKPWYNDLDLRPGLLREPAFLRLVSNPTASLIVQLLGPNIHLHSTSLVCKQPEAPDLPPFRRGWHRDMRVAPDLGHDHLPRVGIKIAYCLTDFEPPGSGFTQMARGSHCRCSPLSVPQGAVDPPDYEVCDLALAAGDALLFENRTYHTATPNRSGRLSKKVFYGYAYRWMRPEVYLDPVDPRYLDGADPVARQLLGAQRDIDVDPWPLLDWNRRHEVVHSHAPMTVHG
ncbi:MAG TPA: phytanoyl-CoA dioxygenase family protein [Thermoanaerobaculia bacterium]|nr:phytanoyl-CoA dioxygenase family protein [Thermoanaerobaculia bacterium]